ncbi:MAG TPA: ABC transporter ATP-binding protein [Rhodopila sp.]
MTALLSVRNLGVSMRTRQGPLHITERISFDLAPGERVGLVGESGCGKSVTGLALMGLLRRRTSTVSGEILLEGRDMNAMREAERRRLRGASIAMVFQEPMSALDPVFTIGEQIGESLRSHFRTPRREARERAIDMLARVGIPDPARRCDEYPHQLSGGMRQRAMIAIALACEPKVLVADEPTTALDVTIQAQVIDLLLRMSEDLGTAMIFITHDIGVVAETCQRVLTMYLGQIVEDAPTDTVLARPRHPYTSGLMRSLPRLGAWKEPLPSIPGRVPSLAAVPAGCRFAPRCTYARAECGAAQPMQEGPWGQARCWQAGALQLKGTLA